LVGEVNTITVALQANDHAVLRYAGVRRSRYKPALYSIFFKPRNSTTVSSTDSSVDALNAQN
jgi:hypothetical protein